MADKKQAKGKIMPTKPAPSQKAAGPKSGPARILPKPAAPKVIPKPTAPAIKAGAKKPPVLRPLPALPVAAKPRPSLRAAIPGAPPLSPRVQALLDKQEIRDIVAATARACDRLDEPLLRGAFHADATIDFGTGIFQGTMAEYIPWQMGVLQIVRGTHHQLGQSRTDIKADSAGCESYLMIQHRLEKPTGKEDLFMGVRWLDRMERRPATPAGVWKIAHRKVVLDWVRTLSVADLFYHHNPDALWSTRGKQDWSYQIDSFPSGQTRQHVFAGRHFDPKSIKW